MEQQNTIKHFSIRVEQETLEKFRYVCRYHCRSANRQMIRLMKEFITAYECEHKIIPPQS